MTDLPPAIIAPRTFSWQPNEYIAISDYFQHTAPLVRTKTAIKTAFTKSFDSLDGDRWYLSDMPKEERLKKYGFGVREIYKTDGTLIFEGQSPIMYEYARGNVTREEVLKSIEW